MQWTFIHLGLTDNQYKDEAGGTTEFGYFVNKA